MNPSLDNVSEFMQEVVAKESRRESETIDRPFEYSATVLCKTPRQVQLERRHKSELPENTFFNSWYSFFGDAIHNRIEQYLRDNPRYLVERRIIRFDKPVGGTEDQYRRVGAKFDAYDKETKTLIDHKTTTTFIHGSEMKPEWIKQLMINAYFLEKEGYPVEKCVINAIYCDWRDSRLTYAKDGEYPAAPCQEFSCKAWSLSDRERLYKNLLASHIEAENLPDDQLPYCDSEYCWESKPVWAVYRPNAQKALRLCASEQEAKSYIEWKGLTGDIRIQERPATRRRCEKYCICNAFCNQYQNWLKEQEAKKQTLQPIEEGNHHEVP